MVIMFTLILICSSYQYQTTSEALSTCPKVDDSTFCNLWYLSKNNRNIYRLNTKSINSNRKFVILKARPVFFAGVRDTVSRIDFNIHVKTKIIHSNNLSFTEYQPSQNIQYHFLSIQPTKTNFNTLIYTPQLVPGVTYDYEFSIDANELADQNNPKSKNLFEVIKRIDVKLTTGNAGFYKYITLVKMIACIISVFFGIKYFYLLSRTPKYYRTIEQNYIMYLSVLLVIYNDPTYWLVIYSPNIFNIFATAIGNNLFFYSLELFWLIVFERIHKENNMLNQTSSNQLWKRVLVSIIICAALITDTIKGYQYSIDPIYKNELKNKSLYFNDRYILNSLLVISKIYIAFHMILCLKKWNQLLQRNQILFQFSIYFIGCFFIYLAFEENHINFELSDQAIVITSISNIYVIGLQLLYSPQNKQKSVKQTIEMTDDNNYGEITQRTAEDEMIQKAIQ